MAEFDNGEKMRIKVGDRVRFLNEVGGGKVKRLLDNKMVEVLTEDGWGVPYLISELVVLPDDPNQEPYKAEVSSDKPVKNILSNVSASEISSRVVLLATQDRGESNQGQFAGIKWYLVNDSDFLLKFNFYQLDSNGTSVIESDELEEGTKMLLSELSLAELSDVKGFHIQGILNRNPVEDVPPLITKYISMNTKKFASAGAYTENEFLHEHAMVFDVIGKESSKSEVIIHDKEVVNTELNKTKQFRSGKEAKQAKEVDLHINQLVDSVVGMSNREIIRIQLERFDKEMNEAIKSGANEIIFIHGIGNGTLKESLRKSIESDYSVCSFEDASFKEYGFGATLVRIRQNR